MGQRALTLTRKTSFTDVLPAVQRTKQATTAASPVESARPVETAVIPVIEAPPHALLRAPASTARVEGEPFAVPESVRKSHTLAQFERTCSEILPSFLYVANLEVARDREALRRAGITHVVNCCKEVACSPCEAEAGGPIAYLELAVRDGVQEDLLPFFPLVVEWIDACRLGGGRVVIHCHQGVSRSCAFAIAYVMYRERCGFQRAHALVKTQRAICAPNAAFLCQLLEWERELEVAETGLDVLEEYGLYRLAPHAMYDPGTLLLKLCYQGNSRRKAVVDLHKTKLWPKGLFVYFDTATHAIVVWKGSQCVIPQGVEIAKQHVTRMLRVLAGELGAAEVTIMVADGDGNDGDSDHFEYASELAWLEAPSVVAAPDPMLTALETSDSSNSREDMDEQSAKPALFSLEPNGTWERVTNYDSDDLLASNALLLVSPHHSYLWIGQDRTDMDDATLRAKALGHLNQNGNTDGEFHIERHSSESEAFWDAFEAGY